MSIEAKRKGNKILLLGYYCLKCAKEVRKKFKPISLRINERPLPHDMEQRKCDTVICKTKAEVKLIRTVPCG